MTKKKERKNKLSKEQKIYVKNKKYEKNTKLIATAGSGKTKCIIERVKYLVKKDLVEKKNIFVLTFSRFSKEDFVKKIKKYKCDQYFEKKNVSTIDSLAKSVLIQLGNKKSSNVELLSLCFRNFLKKSKKKDIRKIPILNQIKYLFVDESQDLNKTQYDIIYYLQTKNKTVTNLIGDPNQNIYQFRQSSDKFLLNHDASTFYLTKNFRSDKNIVKFSNYLRPQITKENKKINCSESKKNKVKVVVDTQYNIHKYVIKQIKYFVKELKMSYSDIAVICPTRGVGIRKDIGLSVFSNLFDKEKIPFEQWYDESGNKEDRVVKKKSKDNEDNNKVCLLTYSGTKGLEWKVVFVADFSEKLMNKLPSNKEESQVDLYSIYVACSRAREYMYLLNYTDKGQINPWLNNVPQKRYENAGLTDYKIPNFKYNTIEKKKITSVTEIISELDPKKLNKIYDMINTNVTEKKIFNDYSGIDRKDDDALFGIFVEELFLLQLNLVQKNPLRKYVIIENIIKSSYSVLNKYEYSVLSDFLGKNKFLTWEIFDSLKNIYSKEINKLVNKHFDRNIEFNENIICQKESKTILEENKEEISRAYNKYLKAEKKKDWKKVLKHLFYICVVIYSVNNNHVYHINNKGKTKKHLLKNFKHLFQDMYKYGKSIKSKSIIQKIPVNHKNTGISGEIDLIIKDRVTEIKCIKEITFKYYLQLALYNFFYRESNDDKYTGKYNLINFYTGKTHKIKTEITNSNMFKIFNILLDVSGLSFNNLNVVYDLETTGLIEYKQGANRFYPKKDDIIKIPEILQITMKDYDDGLLLYNKHVKVSGKIDDLISELTGITEDKINKCPNIDKTKRWLGIQLRNTKSIRLIAHNGNMFDNIITRHYKLIPDKISVSYYDTLNLIPLHMKNEKIESKKLTKLYESVIGKKLVNAHNSLTDVNALIEIMNKLNVTL